MSDRPATADSGVSPGSSRAKDRSQGGLVQVLSASRATAASQKEAKGRGAAVNSALNLARMRSLEVSKLRQAKKKESLRKFCAVIINATWFSVLTTLLTIAALFGDDIRLAVTAKPADFFFNVLTLLCIFVFSVEVVISCWGKDGYYFGIFFGLDILATVTLTFDLTWVSDELFGGGSGSAGDVEKAGRTGRAGVRMTRIVRILRLIRIIKLYKAYKAREDTKTRSNTRRSRPGKSNHFDDDLDEEDLREEMERQRNGEDDSGTESRVGKKLTDYITGRIIFLVLLMMYFIPMFSASDHYTLNTTSDKLALDNINRMWWEFTQQCSTKDAYESELLAFLYVHNPLVTECPGESTCPADFLNHPFHLLWEAPVSGEVEHMGDCPPADPYPWITSDKYTSDGTVNSWNQAYSSWEWYYQTGNLTDHIYTRLTSPWTRGDSCFAETPAAAHVGLSEISCPLEELRWQEYDAIFPSFYHPDLKEKSGVIMVYFDKRAYTAFEALLNVGQTLFICILLAGATVSLTTGAKDLVLNPIERISRKLLVIRDSPMAAIKLGDGAYREEQAALRLEKEQEDKWWTKFWKSKKKQEPMETVILEKTIIKIGGLLALGFGEAGAEIIGENMKGSDTAGVNAMIPGRMVDCIFGYCEIQDFADCTQILQDKVMVFVNQIAEIVHGIVDEYFGAANKNIGEAFLLVWRLVGTDAAQRTRMADFSLMSFVKIVAALNKSATLADYREHPGLIMRIPNFRVTLGCALHVGWSIEGAIGSEFKIDASYLSPNVNICSRLGSCCRHYDLLILMSHVLVNMITPEITQEHLRLVDKVELVGSKTPIGLYTFDLDWRQIEVEQRTSNKVVFKRFKMRQHRERVKETKKTSDFSVLHLLRSDRDIRLMREPYTRSSDFFDTFDMAYRNYEAGEWQLARQMFLDTRNMLAHEDGPSAVLLQYIESAADRSNGTYDAPKTWQGYRALK